MKEHPIIFSTEMVKAIIEDKKAMTRRVIKPQPILKTLERGGQYWDWSKSNIGITTHLPSEHFTHEWAKYCPYGQVGDRLWVRETWYPCLDANQKPREDIAYKASEINPHIFKGEWRPSIFMPKWASRITLEITGIRVERLQDITEEDAKAEGIDSDDFTVHEAIDRLKVGGKAGKKVTAFLMKTVMDESFINVSMKARFMYLWETINGKRYPWSSNPWVWCIEFRRLKP